MLSLRLILYAPILVILSLCLLITACDKLRSFINVFNTSF